MGIFDRLFGKREHEPAPPSARKTLVVDSDGWTRCPSCGFRFKITDTNAWDGHRHKRCGTRLSIEDVAPDPDVEFKAGVLGVPPLDDEPPPLDDEAASVRDYLRSCFEIQLKENDDPRWFSDFDELPVIDATIKNGAHDQALELAEAGLAKYPDSFLFYGRLADVHQARGDAAAAEQVLFDGLRKSKSKATLCERIGSGAFENGDYLKAVRWWTISCVIQTQAETLLHYVPFLHLAYTAEGFGMKQEQAYLLKRADRISSSGPIRYNDEGAAMHYAIAKRLGGSDAKAVRKALTTLRTGYDRPSRPKTKSTSPQAAAASGKAQKVKMSHTSIPNVDGGARVKFVLIVTPCEQPAGDGDKTAIHLILDQLVPEALDTHDAQFAAVWDTTALDNDDMVQKAADVFGKRFLSLDPGRHDFSVQDFQDILGMFGSGSKVMIVRSH